MEHPRTSDRERFGGGPNRGHERAGRRNTYRLTFGCRPWWGQMSYSAVPVPTGWPSVRVTYDAITTKLNSGGTKDQKLAAINYWRLRLQEDYGLIDKGLPPARSPLSPPAPY